MKLARDGEKLTVFVIGRIDTNNASQFGDETEKALDDVKDLTFDFTDLKYISSSGLRVIMMAMKTIARVQGECRIVNVSEDIYEILESTGFTGICDVELKK